ncbi:SprT-like protease [Mycobacterium phage Chupacabra]|uniref:SprT-like protease n=2 Tax=Fromanvirus goose TaxID=1211282 RepID=A0A291AV20_9CAUD|nr:SprT-like protease [Mycobacterium phage OKCentral2016]QHB41260.1 SprT-like protease [Mycobacterium phage Chupacabra]
MTTATMTRTMTLTQAREVTQDLLHEHGLKGWTVRFDNARRRAGQCNYRDRVISLSRPLMALRSAEDTMQTITHEIAHAIVGHGHGHDQVWARKHRELGGNGKRCFEMEAIDPTAPWIGTCDHGKQFARYRAPKRLEGWRCRCRQGSSPVVWEKRR